jgi:hypothetical protein
MYRRSPSGSAWSVTTLLCSTLLLVIGIAPGQPELTKMGDGFAAGGLWVRHTQDANLLARAAELLDSPQRFSIGSTALPVGASPVMHLGGAVQADPHSYIEFPEQCDPFGIDQRTVGLHDVDGLGG